MNKTLMIAIAAGGLTLGGAALAQGPMRGGEDLTRADAEARAVTAFERMDANSDGVLTADDREAHARQRFAAVDANGNGQLSFEEMQAARQEGAERREERRGERAERRGGRGGDRMGHRGGRRGPGGPGLAGLMRQNADTDGDGAISRAEFTAAALVRFDRADADGDGTVTAEERRTHWEAMAPVREAHRAANAQDGE